MIFFSIFARIGELLPSFSELSFLSPDNLFSLLVTPSQLSGVLPQFEILHL